MSFGKAEKSNKWQAIDVHCHILPGLDDGAVDMDETISMLQMALSEGISDIIATPHYRTERFMTSPEKTLEKICLVQMSAESHGIPIKLYPGSEIYWFEGMPALLKQKTLCTLADSDFVLVEFSPSVMFRTIQNALDEIRSEGFRPILAHTERYECLGGKKEGVSLLHGMGAGIQINASAVTGRDGAPMKRFVHRLLEENLVDYIGTDAHGRMHRKPELVRCREILIKKYGSEYAYGVLRGNAQEILSGSQNR